MLEELFPLIREGSNYICVTRPRRFGKTVIANMISSFLGKGQTAMRFLTGCRLQMRKNTVSISISGMSSIFPLMRCRIPVKITVSISSGYENGWSGIWKLSMDKVGWTKMMRYGISYLRFMKQQAGRSLFLYWMNGIIFFIRILPGKAKLSKETGKGTNEKE